MDLTAPNVPIAADYSLSIVIPVHNGGESFRQCLSSLAEFVPESTEIVIVVDGGTDDSWQWAEASGAKVLKLPTASGPARARNLGAQMTQGNLLFFIDADVAIHADTVSQVQQIFQQQPDLAALIGSYDDAPGAANFLSQYKNLFHHYTHQTANEEASTFWGACGAIRREVFIQLGGFDETYRYPSVEDIELGYRLKHAGYRIQLCKTVQVKHLKRWEAVSLLKAEIFYRALPWTELICRDRQLINDLNLKLTSRISTLLVFGFSIALLAAPASMQARFLLGGLGIILLILNWPVYRFFQQKRGLWFSLQVIPWHWLYFLYSGLAFAIGSMRYRGFSHQKSRSSVLLKP